MTRSLKFCRSKRFIKNRLAQSISSALLIPVISSMAVAQPMLEEIIVTATKRSESVMDVSLAITAVSGEFVREINLNDIKDLVKLSPGVTGNSQDSFLDTIGIRGIVSNDFGNGGDPSIGTYKNGNYQGRNGAAVSSLFDIDRVEVLRGPQGFLFGRNAISGAINVHTTKPNTEETSGYIELDVGERGVLVGEGAVNIPLSENLAARLAAYHSEEDGWVNHTPTGRDLLAHDKDALRVSLRYETDKIDTNLILEYEDREQDGSLYLAHGNGQGWDNLTAAALSNGNFAPPIPEADSRSFNSDLGGGVFDRGDVFSLGLSMDYQLEGMVLTSITGYRSHDYAYAEDTDGTSVELFHYSQDQSGDYFEQELRLTSENDDSALGWYAGASYYKEDIDTVFSGVQAEEVYCAIYYYGGTCTDLQAYYGYVFTASPDGLIHDENRIVGDYQGYAAYVDLGYAFNDTFDVSVGVRYSYDEKEFSQENLPDVSMFSTFNVGSLTVQAPPTPNGKVSDTQDWDSVTWRVVGNYHMNDDTLLFASVSTGAKSGGFNSFIIDERGLPAFFDKETVISYELGYKATVWEGQSLITANAFYYEYEDLQIVFFEAGSPVPNVGNIGKVESIGFEGTMTTALTENITLDVGVSWLDSEVSGYQAVCEPVGSDACEGQKLLVPEWTFYGALKFNYPVANGMWAGNLIYSAEDEESSVVNPALALESEGVKELQLTAGFVSEDDWSLKVYIENLTDENGYDSIFTANSADGSSNLPNTHINPVRPRTVGVRFGYKF